MQQLALFPSMVTTSLRNPNFDPLLNCCGYRSSMHKTWPRGTRTCPPFHHTLPERNEMDTKSNAVLTLDLEHPVEKVFAELILIFRERNAKYTSASWDDNFRYVAKRAQEQGVDIEPDEVATILMLVKEARTDAATKSGRTDFNDDSLRDSDLDDINYRVLRRALRDVT